jgi:2-keto-4-pentenoate hydratase/2-oxohepta-3-ene-1,7-dioic acid hydratase in catechol pathway
MKIICIGRNYVEHIKELNNETPSSPVIFLKPDTAILRNNDAFYYPEFSNNIHYEVEIVLKISKIGKYIETKFAHTYYDEIGIGIDFTARDLQDIAKEKGLPWDLAKGFNSSAPISTFVSKSDYNDINDLNFGLKIGGEWRQKGNTSHMIYDFNHIIAYISKFITLKKGDLLFTGTPKGVGAVNRGDLLEAYIEDKKLLEVEVK